MACELRQLRGGRTKRSYFKSVGILCSAFSNVPEKTIVILVTNKLFPEVKGLVLFQTPFLILISYFLQKHL